MAGISVTTENTALNCRESNQDFCPQQTRVACPEGEYSSGAWAEPGKPGKVVAQEELVHADD